MIVAISLRRLPRTPYAVGVSGRLSRVAFNTLAPGAPSTPPSSVDASELRKFASQSSLWWRDDSGPFAALHSLNRVRVPLIRQALLELSLPMPQPTQSAGQPLRGFRILDVGCGGGILSEALARLGAGVLGIDAADENVRAATLHRDSNPRLVKLLSYETVTAEKLLLRGVDFDAVVASEVIEHVRDPQEFVRTCSGLVRVRRVVSAAARFS